MSDRVLLELESAKTRAKDLAQEVSETIAGLECSVKGWGSGAASGYSYLISTGREGIAWAIKKSSDISQWNLRASVTSSLLQAVGFEGAVKQLYEDLEAMEANTIGESVARVDYCVDIQMEPYGASNPFILEPENFITHSRVSRAVELSAPDDSADYVKVYGKKYVETVTLGKMPGRQVQIYNKRVEQIAKRSQRWFAVWGFNQENCPAIWRVEIRAGKKYLGDWNVKSFEDVQNCFGDLCQDAMKSVRYLENGRVKNVTKQGILHPFWTLAQTTILKATADSVSGIVRGKFVSMRKEDARDMYESLLLGLAVSGAVTRGAKVPDDLDDLPDYIARLVREHLRYSPDKVAATLKKTIARLNFIEEKET